MRHVSMAALLTSAAIIAGAAPAGAGPLTVSASLYTPQVVAGTATPIALSGMASPSASTITALGYSISFANVPSGQGVVQGALAGRHAIPVAGVIGGAAEYLTGDYGSALTTRGPASGNYLSTDLGTITVAFDRDQRALALLWGSIDASNGISLLEDGSTIGSVSGAQVQAAASGFAGNGFQGPGGSAYVEISSALPFDRIELTSGMISFEAAGIVGSTSPIDVPEPTSLALLGAGIAATALIRRKRS